MTAGSDMSVYPGHGQSSVPTKGPRVKVEGEPNYIKNKGTIKQRVFDDTAPIIKTPKPNPRCPTSDSVNNYKAGWFGTVPPLLHGITSPRPSSAPARIKPEAEAIAHVSRGPRMKVIVHNYARSGPSPRQPRVKSEAQQIAELSKGGRMNNIIHKYGNMKVEPRPVPRLNLKAEPSAENSHGQQTRDIFYKYGQNRSTHKPQPRVKPEGETNAELDKGQRMNRLFKLYGKCLQSARSVPRVKPEGEPNANLDTGFRMCRLMHEPESLPNTPRPTARTNSSQARWNALKGRGSMTEIFRNIAQTTFIHVPGQQPTQYMRASIA